MTARLLPLADYRVVDLTQVWAGPQLASTLGDMGAEVIRVESSLGTDIARQSAIAKSEFRQALDAQRHNRSRACNITLNMGSPEGSALFKELIKSTDIFVCNVTTRVLRKFGAAYEDLRRVRPDLIMAVISAAGQDGPHRDLLAFGPSFNAVAGHDSLVGYPDTGEPMNAYWDPDPAMASMSIYAVMLAIYHREETGEGQFVDLNFSEFLTGLLGEAALEYQVTGKAPGPQGNLHPWMAPHGIYPCAGDDSWLSIAVGSEDEWRALCQAMREPSLATDPRFATMALRHRNRDALDEAIARWTRTQNSVEAMRLLQRAGVAAAPAFNIGEIYHDPHDTFRRTWTPLEVPGMRQEELLFGVPWHLSETPAVVRSMGKPMGHDNQRFLAEWLGLPASRIADLQARKALA